MTTYKLFEHATSSGDGTTPKYYIRMESNFPSQIYLGNMQSVKIMETFGAGSPICTLDFIDTIGSLVNTSYIDPATTYNVFFGRDPSSATVAHPFMLSGMSSQSTVGGELANLGTSIAFLNPSWQTMLNTSKSRGWSNVLMSNVATQVARECGFNPVNVEKTDVSFLVTLQPQMTDYEFLKWLAKYSRSSTGHVGYDIIVGADNSFTFSSYDAFALKSPVRNLYFRGRGVTDVNLYGMKITNQFVDATDKTGAFGMQTTYFDYATRSFKTTQTDITKSSMVQLSDWCSVPSNMIGPYNNIYGAQFSGTEEIVSSGIIARANIAALKLDFTMLGDNALHVGDVVNILMNTNEHLKTQINEQYSGYWMIYALTHVFDFTKTIYNTQVTCVRAGMNGKSVTGMSRTATGKKLAPLPTSLSVV